MKKICFKALAVFLAVMVFLPVTPAFAVTEQIAYASAETSDVGLEIEALMEEIDVDRLNEVVISAFLAGEESIDLSEFKIPVSKIGDFLGIIWYNMPQAFCVRSCTYSYKGGFLTKINPEYSKQCSNYPAMLAECEEAADYLLFGIENNSKLGDVEKALLIHDRLLQYCEYDSIGVKNGNVSSLSYTMYGALVNRVAVCQGYANAYTFLLNRVGIENYYISSAALNHAWNILYINGIPYHVDCTYDDPAYDHSGRARHNNFLLSTGAFKSNHDAKDYDTAPVTTTYDKSFWKNSGTAFQLIGDYIYYLTLDDDLKKQYLYKSPCGTVADNSDDTLITSFSDKWFTSEKSYFQNQSALCSDGRNLFFNMEDEIYKFDVEKGTSAVFYKPESIGDYYKIYGFM